MRINHRPRRGLLVAAVSLLLAACGKPAPPPPPASAPPSPPTGVPAAWGTVTGVVVLKGGEDPSPLVGLTKGFEEWCGSGPLDPGIYRIDPSTRGVADVFVSVDGPSAEWEPGKVPVLDQDRCVFRPPLLAMPPGELLLRNSDRIAHNTTLDGKVNARVNENLPPGASVPVRLSFEEKLQVRCTLHPWMRGVVVVTRSKSHAVTDASGRFRIEGVPAGRRKLKAWHLLGPEVESVVEVPPDGTVEVPLTWAPRPAYRAGFGR